MKFELVKIQTSDGLLHNGLFSEGRKDKPVILHIHGYTGNMYANSFISATSEKLKQHNIGFLTVQHRGSYSRFECYTINKDENRQLGSHYETLEEAYLDIDAWILFLKKRGQTNIILQGHSLGAQKVIRYLFEGSLVQDINKLILLSPFDNVFANNQASLKKHIQLSERAKQDIADGRGLEMCPYSPEEFPLSCQSFASWGANNDFGCMFDFYKANYDFPILNKITIPTKMIVGTKDERLRTPQKAANTMAKHIKHFEYKLIDNAPHCFEGYDQELANEILDFVET